MDLHRSSKMFMWSISRTIFVYNPTDQRRVQLVKVLLDTSKVFVTSNKQPIPACQVDPSWSGRKSNTMQTDRFEVCLTYSRRSLYSFVRPSLAPDSSWHRSLFTEGIHNPCQHWWTIVSIDDARIFRRERTAIEHIRVCVWTIRVDLLKNLDLLSRPFPINIIDKKNVKLSNRFLSISFSRAGSFLHVHHLEHNEKVSFNAQVIHYSTENRGERNSGAYLFLPDGDGKEIPMRANDRIRIQRGPLVSRIDLLHEMYGLQYKLAHTNGELFLWSTKTKEYRDECEFF